MLKVFETFAGIGSQTKALKNIGIKHEVVAISEWDIQSLVVYDRIHNNNQAAPSLPLKNGQIDKDAIVTYLNKFTFSSDTKHPIKNIAKLPLNKLIDLFVANQRSKNLGSIVNLELKEIPDHDLLTYSFPCQAISLQGKRNGLEKGTGTSSSLLWEIEKILIYLKENNKLPKYLLMENVAALFSSKFLPGFKVWIDFLNSLGYETKYDVLTASHFDIPQNRKRAFAISVLNDKTKFNNIKLPTGKLTEKTIEDILELPSEKRFLMPHLNHKISKQNTLKKDSGIHSNLLLNYTTFQSENIVYYTDGIAPTITATGAQSRIKIWDNHENSIRMLSPLEHWKLMGFTKEDFQNAQIGGFEISENILKKMAGNSIVVNVLEAIFSEMYQ